MNADELISTARGVYSHNMYIYTENNPINRIDSEGKIWLQIAGTVGGALINGGLKLIENAVTGNNLSDGIWGALAQGAFKGFIATTPLGIISKSQWGMKILGSAISAYGGASIESTINQAFSGGINTKALYKDTLRNGTGSFISNLFIPEVFKLNKGWGQPQSFVTALTGNYGKKVLTNIAASSAVNSTFNILKAQASSVKSSSKATSSNSCPFGISSILSQKPTVPSIPSFGIPKNSFAW